MMLSIRIVVSSRSRLCFCHVSTLFTLALEEMVRVFSLPNKTYQVFAVPFGISSGFYTAMIGGGPASLVWGFILVGCLQECVAVSLGEICSRFPTSGLVTFTLQSQIAVDLLAPSIVGLITGLMLWLPPAFEPC